MISHQYQRRLPSKNNSHQNYWWMTLIQEADLSKIITCVILHIWMIIYIYLFKVIPNLKNKFTTPHVWNSSRKNIYICGMSISASVLECSLAFAYCISVQYSDPPQILPLIRSLRLVQCQRDIILSTEII